MAAGAVGCGHGSQLGEGRRGKLIRAAVARIWGESLYRELQRPFPDCGRCRLDSSAEQRVLWGCDAPATAPCRCGGDPECELCGGTEEQPRMVFEVGCSSCDGKALDCATCGGAGKVSMDRCPSAMMREAPRELSSAVDLLMRLYAHYDRHGALPAPGGLLDQTASFVSATALVDHERGRLQQMKADEMKRQQEAQRRRSAAPAQRRRR